VERWRDDIGFGLGEFSEHNLRTAITGCTLRSPQTEASPGVETGFAVCDLAPLSDDVLSYLETARVDWNAIVITNVVPDYGALDETSFNPLEATTFGYRCDAIDETCTMTSDAYGTRTDKRLTLYGKTPGELWMVPQVGASLCYGDSGHTPYQSFPTKNGFGFRLYGTYARQHNVARGVYEDAHFSISDIDGAPICRKFAWPATSAREDYYRLYAAVYASLCSYANALKSHVPELVFDCEPEQRCVLPELDTLPESGRVLREMMTRQVTSCQPQLKSPCAPELELRVTTPDPRVGQPIEFSVSGHRDDSLFLWDFDGGSHSVLHQFLEKPNPSYTYDAPYKGPVLLSYTDGRSGCERAVTVQVDVAP